MAEPEDKSNHKADGQEAIPTAAYGGAALGPGAQIGPYKLLSILGEGGYGVVYLAEQQRPIKRRVALKVIKPGMDTKQVIARFEAERQALALLDHPNIAHVYDAGTTQNGRPYFVMEYVKGVPITEHCDLEKLAIEERFGLFLQVCEAVQHAHQKGIIHRDIKPSNVQVAIHGEQAVPKIIDFGVAKAISQPLTERTLVTEQGQFVGTPEYMSPEQAEMTTQDIDTRTDIYSLGVVLYELLTGTLPFASKTLREGGVDHIRHMIREEDPKTPSTRLSTISGEESTRVAQLRRTDVRTLGRKLHGDLDWITIKAMEKDRMRRYQTAHALAEDIQRHLDHEPVLAGPPSKIYRLKKFLRRHRAQAVAAATAAVLLACMVLVSVMYLRGVKRVRESELLEHESILSKAMEFRSLGQFEDALSGLDPILNSEHVGPKARLLRARLVLDLQGPAEAVKELEELLEEKDEIAGQAHFLLAQIYYESDPDAPGRTEDYRLKWEHHRREAERLLSQSADAYLLRAMTAGAVQQKLTLLNKALEYDERHYDSLRERAYLSYAGKNYYKMAKDAATMIGIQPDNPLGYSLSAVAQRELRQFDEAIEDHHKAIERSPSDAELYDQRRRTHMYMGNYERALSDARKCTELQPEKGIYHFHAFCALVALGRYDEARLNCEEVFKSDSQAERQYRSWWSRKYVFETLNAGLSWYPAEPQPPRSGIFLAMYDADEEYRQVADKARLVVSDGFHPNWSPQGTELVYSCGVLGSSGIEILDLKSGRTRLLATPGKDPDWSPDGKYIVYVRDRQILPLDHLLTDRERAHGSMLREEVWLIKADGTEEPRYLARGGWPCWGSDSKRVFYHSRVSNKVCSISIEDGAKPTPIIWWLGYYPAVSPDGKYVAHAWGGGLQIFEVSSKSAIIKRTLPSGGLYLMRWSPDGRTLSLPAYDSSLGLCLYDKERDETSSVLGGSIGWCSWSPAETNQVAIVTQQRRGYSGIWVADTAAIGPSRPLEERYEEMVSHFTRRIEAEPENAENYLSRAPFHIYLGDKKKALADLDRYVEIVKDPPRAAGVYGDLAFDSLWANPEIAVELYRKAHEMQPGNWLYLGGLGRAYYNVGQWAEAITEFAKSAKLPGGDNGFNFLCLSMAHWQRGDKEKAGDFYAKAIERMQDGSTDDALRPLLDFVHAEASSLLGIELKNE